MEVLKIFYMVFLGFFISVIMRKNHIALIISLFVLCIFMGVTSYVIFTQTIAFWFILYKNNINKRSEIFFITQIVLNIILVYINLNTGLYVVLLAIISSVLSYFISNKINNLYLDIVIYFILLIGGQLVFTNNLYGIPIIIFCSIYTLKTKQKY